jgi:hypothetical protein
MWTTTNTAFGCAGGTSAGYITGTAAYVVFYFRPPPPRPCLKDTRSRAQKIADLAARATTDGEREACLAKLAELQAKGKVA